jgi:hypothetical protein
MEITRKTTAPVSAVCAYPLPPVFIVSSLTHHLGRLWVPYLVECARSLFLRIWTIDHYTLLSLMFLHWPICSYSGKRNYEEVSCSHPGCTGVPSLPPQCKHRPPSWWPGSVILAVIVITLLACCSLAIKTPEWPCYVSCQGRILFCDRDTNCWAQSCGNGKHRCLRESLGGSVLLLSLGPWYTVFFLGDHSTLESPLT